MQAQDWDPSGQFSGIPANFSGKRYQTSLFLLLFIPVLIGCGQWGFGADSDAWLLAHTARKWQLGLGYDPARSFGNPLYEAFLSLLPYPEGYRWANGLNSVLALLLLFRMRRLFPLLDPLRLGLLQISWLCFPLFLEAATSTMEYLPAWVCWLEAHLRIRERRFSSGTLFALVAAGFRPELGFLIPLTAWISSQTRNPLLVIPLVFSLLWCGFHWGRNPLPFDGWHSAPAYYARRWLFVAGQMGAWFPLFGWSLFRLFTRNEDRNPDRLAAGVFVGFFLLFPFEWAYAFPALLLSLGRVVEKLPIWLPGAGLLFLFTSAFFPVSYPDRVSVPGLPGPLQQRIRMQQENERGKTYAPSRNTLLLFGATWIPNDPQAWEKSPDNRMFHRKNSRLWVAERLSGAEVDSLRKAGFRIAERDLPPEKEIRQRPDPGKINPGEPEAQWLKK